MQDKNIFTYGKATSYPLLNLTLTYQGIDASQIIAIIPKGARKRTAANLECSTSPLLSSLNGMPLIGGITDPLVYLDDILYQEVLRSSYPEDVCEAYSFVTRDRNALYLLLESNTILVNQGIYINKQLEKLHKHVERLRADASSVIFRKLEATLGQRELDRVKANTAKSLELITFIALLFQAVLEFHDRFDERRHATGGKTRMNMLEHLEYILCYHLHDLSIAAFPGASDYLKPFGIANCGAFMHDNFWPELAHARNSASLAAVSEQRPESHTQRESSPPIDEKIDVLVAETSPTDPSGASTKHQVTPAPQPELRDIQAESPFWPTLSASLPSMELAGSHLSCIESMPTSPREPRSFTTQRLGLNPAATTSKNGNHFPEQSHKWKERLTNLTSRKKQQHLSSVSNDDSPDEEIIEELKPRKRLTTCNASTPRPKECYILPDDAPLKAFEMASNCTAAGGGYK